MRLSSAAIQQQILDSIAYLHQYSRLPSGLFHEINDRRFVRALASTLRHDSIARVRSYTFRLENLRSLSARSVETVLVSDDSIRPERTLTAFVGHRFTDKVKSSLRHNLQLALEPYGIKPVYSDTDMPNGSIFENILRCIRECDLAIFDDRETEVRPNVLIELGVAIGLNKPYLFFNYSNKRAVAIANRRERITVPSDLSGMLAFNYTRYDELFRAFSLRLPGFLLHRGLAKVA